MGQKNSTGITSSGAALNLYENVGADEAVNITELEEVIPDWEEELLPEKLRTSSGLHNSYDNILGPNAIKIPKLLPKDYCTNPTTATLYLKCIAIAGVPELKLSERVPMKDFKSQLRNFFEGLFSLGYRQINFTVVRPFVEVSYVSPGASTGGYEHLFGDDMNAYDPEADYVKSVFWSIAIQGEVAEIQDELTPFKKQIQVGIPAHQVFAKMRKLKMQHKTLRVMETWVNDFMRTRAKRGRRAGADHLELIWSYQYAHVGRDAQARDGPQNDSADPMATGGDPMATGGARATGAGSVGGGGASAIHGKREDFIRYHEKHMSVGDAVKEIHSRLDANPEDMAEDLNEVEPDGNATGDKKGAGTQAVDSQSRKSMRKTQTAERAKNKEDGNSREPLGEVQLSHEYLRPYVTIEKAKNSDVKDFMRTANIAMLRDNNSRMARCLKIASDKMVTAYEQDEAATQQIFWSLNQEQRELFIVGAKSRLRALYDMFDRGELGSDEFGRKVEAMAHQIVHFIDFVALPCLSYFDVVVSVDTRDQLSEIVKKLDTRCYVSESLHFKGEAFGAGDYIKSAGNLQNAPPIISGVMSQAEIDEVTIRELAGDTSGGGGTKMAQTNYMKLSDLTSRTPVPCKITISRNTSVQSMELISKWVCWKADWFRYMCVMGHHLEKRQIQKTAILAGHCYKESLRMSGTLVNSHTRVVYENLVCLLNYAVHCASVERNYVKAQDMIDKAVTIIDEAEEKDDSALKIPKIKILTQNALRLQRTLHSHMVVLSVTVADWDILGLLKDAGPELLNQPGQDDSAPSSRAEAGPKIVPAGEKPSIIQQALEADRLAGGDVWTRYTRLCCGSCLGKFDDAMHDAPPGACVAKNEDERVFLLSKT